MFGKISAIVNYQKIWDVYIVKRFPSNRISVWGMAFSYSLAFWMMHRMLTLHRSNSLKRLRCMDKATWTKCPVSKYWSFNPNYIKK